MEQSAQRLEGFIDLIVEAVLRDMKCQNKNGDESGQEQRRREDQSNATISLAERRDYLLDPCAEGTNHSKSRGRHFRDVHR